MRNLPTFLILSLAGLLAPAAAQTPLGVNLLTNPGFENNLTGWTAVVGTVKAESYGTAGYPTVPLSVAIGGQGRFVADLGGNGSILEQVVNLVGLAQGTHAYVGGYFGGSANDASALVVRFLDSAGGEISKVPFAAVTDQERNFENVLLLREGRLPIPNGTARIGMRIEFINNCCSATAAAADNLFLVLSSASILPPPVPVNTELLNNPSFENGWAQGSPLQPALSQGWRGISGSPVVVKAYNSSQPLDLPPSVSCVIGGGLAGINCLPGGSGNYLSHTDVARVRQRIDLRGNTAQFATLGKELLVSGFLGGTTSQNDSAAVEVIFRDANLNILAPLPLLGPVTSAQRNSETALLARTATYIVPPQTAFADFDLLFANACCSQQVAAMDKLSAVLRATTLPAAPPSGANLIVNGSFEEGSLPGSPLVLTNSKGWIGLGTSTTSTREYGSGASLPPLTFAIGSGLGGLLLGDQLNGDSSNMGLRQVIDVSPLASKINAGQVKAFVQVWLGGHSNFTDRARLELRTLNGFGGLVGGVNGLKTLGPVTAQQRQNQTTLLKQESFFVLSAGTESLQVDLLFDNDCCSFNYAMVDDVRVVLFDASSGTPILLPGTNEDVRLFTGINASPTSGPGQETKTAMAGDVLNFQVTSPGGTYNFGPLIVAATVYPTGGGFPLLLPSVQLDVNNAIFLLNALGCTGFGCPALVPNGTAGSVPIVPGLNGKTIRIQALVFPPLGSSVVPANGVYATSEAHEIKI